MEKRIIPGLHQGIGSDPQISQNRIEVECNRDEDRERVTYFEWWKKALLFWMDNSEWIKSSLLNLWPVSL